MIVALKRGTLMPRFRATVSVRDAQMCTLVRSVRDMLLGYFSTSCAMSATTGTIIGLR